MKLTNNFNLSEVTNWVTSNKEIYFKEVDSLLKDEQVLKSIREVANVLQNLRDKVNREFNFGCEISFRVTSWLRPVAYEIAMGRTGKSQHTKGHAVDFIARGIGKNLTTKQTNDVMQFCYNELEKLNTVGLAYKKNNLGNFTFVHIDLRGKKARWTY